MLSSTTSYTVSKPEIIREQFDEEVVIVDLDTGSYYSLSGAGGEVWSAIESGTSTAGIVQQLGASYDAEVAEIEASLGRLLEELQAEGLITPLTAQSKAEVEAKSVSEAVSKQEWQAPLLQKFTDMQALLLLDPIHEVDSAGWPLTKPEEPVMVEMQTNKAQ
jgi:hypothetical protein